MTYIDYLNQFDRWLEQADRVADKSVVLYYAFLSMFNRRGWPTWAGVDTQRLMMMARATNKNTAFRARDQLITAGLIAKKDGNRKYSCEYRICELGVKFDTERGTELVTKNETENVSERGTERVTKNVPPNKTNKTKTKNPPKSPQGDDTFAAFWSAYPRKDSKAKAKASWDKLKPDKELVSQIMAALEQHKRSDQWTRDGGQYIPYPATWLNQRRWEDEGITQTQPEPPKKRVCKMERDENGEVVSVEWVQE